MCQHGQLYSSDQLLYSIMGRCVGNSPLVLDGLLGNAFDTWLELFLGNTLSANAIVLAKGVQTWPSDAWFLLGPRRQSIVLQM